MFLRKEIAFPFAFILADSSWGWGGVPGWDGGGTPPPHGLDEREPPPGVDVFFEHEGSPWVVGWVSDAGPKHRRCIRASPACFEAGIVGLAEFLFGFLPDLGFGGSILWVLMLWWLGHHSCFLGNSFLGVNLGDPKNLRC